MTTDPHGNEDLGRAVTETLPEVIAVYLFGSFAADAANASSDIDRAIVRAAVLRRHER